MSPSEIRSLLEHLFEVIRSLSVSRCSGINLLLQLEISCNFVKSYRIIGSFFTSDSLIMRILTNIPKTPYNVKDIMSITSGAVWPVAMIGTLSSNHDLCTTNYTAAYLIKDKHQHRALLGR